jgi:HEAT repeat protein
VISLEQRLAEIDRAAALGGPAELRALLELLGDDEWQTRRAAALAIAQVVPSLTDVDARDRAIGDLLGAVVTAEDAPQRAAAIVALEAIGRLALPHLAVALRDAAAPARTALAGVVGAAGGAGAVSLLEPLSREADQNVAAAATLALGRTRSPDALPLLLQRLDEGDDWLKFAACGALAELGDGRAVDRLAGFLDDDLFRETAIASLVEIGTIEAVKVLGDLVWDPVTSTIQPDLLMALVSVAAQSSTLPQPLADTIREIARRSIPHAARDPLLNLLADCRQSKESGKVNACLTVMGWLGDLRALPCLGSKLHDSAFSQTARELMVAFAETDNGVTQLLDLTPDLLPPIEAVAVLTEIQSWAAFEGLLRLGSESDDAETTDACLQAFSVYANWFDAHLEYLTDEARARIESTLGHLIFSGSAALPIEAARLLGNIAQGWTEAEVERIAKELLGKATEGGIVFGLKFLFECAPARAAAEAVHALKHPGPRARVAAIETIARLADHPPGVTLTTHLTDESASVRRAAARALRLAGRGPEAKRALSACLIDDDIWVRFEVIASLAERWGQDAEVTDRLAEELFSPHPICRVAAVEAQPDLAETNWSKMQDLAAHDPQTEVRMAALRQLLRHPRKRLVRVELARSLNDPEWPVRLAALDLAITSGQWNLADRVADLPSDPNEAPAVRAHAIRAVAEWAHPAAVFLAVSALDDTSHTVVEAAFAALTQLSDARAAELAAHCGHCSPLAANYLRFILSAAGPGLITHLEPPTAFEMSVGEQA